MLFTINDLGFSIAGLLLEGWLAFAARCICALALLFIGAALVRIPTVLIAVVLHLCERGSDQLIAWAESIPPQPSRRRTRRRSGTRGDQA